MRGRKCNQGETQLAGVPNQAVVLAGKEVWTTLEPDALQ